MFSPLCSCLALLAAAFAISACVLPAAVVGASAWQPWLRGLAAVSLAGGAVLAWRRRRFPIALGIGTFVVLPVVLLPARTAEWVADASLVIPRGDAGIEKLDLPLLRERFNAASDGRRVVALFSPT